MTARRRETSSRATVAYVSMLAAVAGGVSFAAARFATPVGHPQWQSLPLLAGLLLASEALSLRYQYRNHVETFTVVEAALAPLLVGFGGLVVVLMMATVQASVQIAGRNKPIKAAFNVSQWSLAAASAALVTHSLTPAGATPWQSLLALLAALATLTVVNQGALSIVLILAASDRNSALSRQMLVLRASTQTVAICFGVLVAGVFLWNSWAVAFFLPPLVMLHFAGRGVAAVAVDRQRLGALQHATHTLAVTLNPAAAYPELLRTVRKAFEVRAVELLFLREDGPELHRLAEGTYSQDLGELSPLLSRLTDVTAPSRITRQEGDEQLRAALVDAGWQDCLVVPLRNQGRTVGVLCLYDRTGMVAFEDGELTVAAAIGAEIVGFMERANLVDSLVEERRKLSEIVGSTSDGILTLAADGTIDSWNTGMEAMTGYTASEMVGTAHFGQLRPRDPAGADLHLEHWATAQQPLPAQMQILTAGGETCWLSCSYTPIPATEGRGDTCIIVARNVTQEHELERLKDDFVAVVSHELRTPLSSIKGWTNTLISRRERMSPEQQADGLQAISRQAHRLEQLVLNILEASRIEAGMRGTDETVDVSHVVRKVVEDVTALYPSRVIRAEGVMAPTLALGQHVWIERAVANLLFNAVKYSPDDEPVDIRVDWAGTEIAIVVTDRGTGIPAEATDRIFDRFERLPGAQTQTGTGLGLYITRQLVAAMDGTVEVEPNPGGGSIFTVRLAAAALRVPQQSPPSRSENWLRLVD